RGDRPVREHPEASHLTQAPRTWRWTGIYQGVQPPHPPSPTHVGMDRWTRRAATSWDAKPHAGEDGPHEDWDDWLDDCQAPRTWGWTVCVGIGSGSVVPSPTHVGMDRTCRCPRGPARAEPHARGDGPRAAVQCTAPAARAPRTWGWTVHVGVLGVQPVPSPTHVGMDRVRPSSAPLPLPEPHARGDGPQREQSA